MIVANAIINIMEEFEWLYLNYCIHCCIHCLERESGEEGEMRQLESVIANYNKNEWHIILPIVVDLHQGWRAIALLS